MKYLIVTGGVLSGLGKGTCSSSIGSLLQKHGKHVSYLKIDPYFNLHAGHISPSDHGEVFVCADGTECDLDIGTAERAMDITLTGKHNLTSGKLFKKVLEKEEKGEYLGQTIQLIPHMTDAVIQWIEDCGAIPVEKSETKAEILIIEVGGTVGDYESQLFLEALRQLRFKSKSGDFIHIHMSFLPFLNEFKTKPTQHSMTTLRTLGLIPDLLVCRSDKPFPNSIKDKLAKFCMIEHVFGLHNLDNLYDVPAHLEVQKLDKIILTKLEYVISESKNEYELETVRLQTLAASTFQPIIYIALVGKYTKAVDAYLSIHKALEHTGRKLGIKIKVFPVDSEKKEDMMKMISEVNGIIIPGGFGTRGVLEMLPVIEYARTSGKPILGICLGMQLMIIEYIRNVDNETRATSAEFDQNDDAVLVIEKLTDIQLGNREIVLEEDTLAHSIYGKKKIIKERHRHRYGFIHNYIDENLLISGKPETKDVSFAEIIELKDHPFFLGMQFHPEFTSRPNAPSPVFVSFIHACQDYDVPKSSNIKKRKKSK